MDGMVISERYEILDTLGKGGMGVVLKCHDTILNRFVAVKVLGASTSETAIKRFQLEARASAKLKQANILQVHDFGETSDGKLYLVMDFVEGITLDELLKERKFLPLEEALPLFRQICLGIAHAHGQGVLHRDIKPSNIMLADSDTDWVKIVDFGIAKLNSEDQKLTSTGAFVGSPPYMAPETTLNKGVDARSDIYSIGCLMFQTLTGTVPFKGQSAVATVMMHATEPVPGLLERADQPLPAKMGTIVASCLAKHPDDRYKNVDALLTDLEDLERTLLSVAARDDWSKEKTEKENETTTSGERQPAKPSKTLIAALAASASLAIALGVVVGVSVFKLPLVPDHSHDKKVVFRIDRVGKSDYNPFGEPASNADKYAPILTGDSSPIVDSTDASGAHCAKAGIATNDEQVIKHLKQFNNIHTWRLSDSQIGIKSIEEIAKTKVKFLELKNTIIDDECIRLIGGIKELMGLQLGGCMKITPAGLKPLKNNKHLFTIQVSLPKVPGDAMKVLDTLETIEGLRNLDAMGTMDGAMIKKIARFKRLESVQLETPTADGWNEMKKLAKLSSITMVIDPRDKVNMRRAEQLELDIPALVIKHARRGPVRLYESFNTEFNNDVEERKEIPFLTD